MTQHHSNLRRAVAALTGGAVFAVFCGSAYGQADLIGARGGQTAPTLASVPTLPSTLQLPTEAASSLLNGLNASGTALRPGMGWLVSDLKHQGIRGRQLADIIHQLKPYKQRGVLTFPQTQQPAAGPLPGVPLQPQPQPPSDDKFKPQRKEIPQPGHGNGHGNGNGNNRGKGGGGRGGGKGGKG